MMSLTISLERPFSAESCASPVTSSRFMSHAPLFFYFWRQKKWVVTHFFDTVGARGRPRVLCNYTTGAVVVARRRAARTRSSVLATVAGGTFRSAAAASEAE